MTAKETRGSGIVFTQEQ